MTPGPDSQPCRIVVDLSALDERQDVHIAITPSPKPRYSLCIEIVTDHPSNADRTPTPWQPNPITAMSLPSPVADLTGTTRGDHRQIDQPVEIALITDVRRRSTATIHDPIGTSDSGSEHAVTPTEPHDIQRRRRLATTLAAAVAATVVLGVLLATHGNHAASRAAPQNTTTRHPDTGIDPAATDCFVDEPTTPGSCPPRSTDQLTDVATMHVACQHLLDQAAHALGTDPTSWTQHILLRAAATDTTVDDIVRQELTTTLTQKFMANHEDLSQVPNIRTLDAAVAETYKRPCSTG